MITVYTLTYNEELLMQFMIDHYRSRFPGCRIVVYDNSSTDKTVEIAKANNCEVRTYDSGGTLNDGLHMRIKNSCWKDATTDWVVVCDLDEMLDILPDELKHEESLGTTVIKAEGWTYVNLGDDLDVSKFTHGIRDGGYDKNVLFNKKHIREINYGVGCHGCNPIGNVKFGSKQYVMYHYRDIHPDIAVQHAKTTASRLSADNRRYGWGIQCTRTEKEIRDDFERLRKVAIEVPRRK